MIKINNNVTVGGSVTAPDLSYKATKVTIGGTATEASVDIVEIPDIDLTPYYNYALAHGEVYNGFTTTTDINPNGGILWVNGDVHISSHSVVHGSIIATGDINMSGQVDINPTTCAFGLVSRDGDIQVTSSGTIYGLIYAKTGGLQHTANGEIRGQVIVNGDIKKAGNSDIMTSYATSVPAAPGGQYHHRFCRHCGMAAVIPFPLPNNKSPDPFSPLGSGLPFSKSRITNHESRITNHESCNGTAYAC